MGAEWKQCSPDEVYTSEQISVESCILHGVFFAGSHPVFRLRSAPPSSFVSRARFSSIPPSPVKSLEASRRGRERRLVTFPSRPLFLSYTHAVPRPHGREPTRAGLHRADTHAGRLHFLPFYPCYYITFPVQGVRRVSRCILMKKFVTSLRHPAAASARQAEGEGISFCSGAPTRLRVSERRANLCFSHDPFVRNK